MTGDIDEAIDWQGAEIGCGSCVHRELLDKGGCALKHACVQDRYARRIARFFAWNPSLANGYTGHPYFEVRAAAAKHADVFQLPPLLADPDESVRWNAVRRLPRRYLLLLRNDPHREVRIRVASLLNADDLRPMIRDPDYFVRLMAARRIAPDLLPAMMHDGEAAVRRVVASRIQGEALYVMAADEDAEVRLAVVRRLEPEGLTGFHRDPDWRVRYEAARRLPQDILSEMLDDPDGMVREFVRERHKELAAQDQPGNVVRLDRGTSLKPSGRR